MYVLSRTRLISSSRNRTSIDPLVARETDGRSAVMRLLERVEHSPPRPGSHQKMPWGSVSSTATHKPCEGIPTSTGLTVTVYVLSCADVGAAHRANARHAIVFCA